MVHSLVQYIYVLAVHPTAPHATLASATHLHPVLWCKALLSSIFQACSTCHHLHPSTTTSRFINLASNQFSIDGRDIRGTGMGFRMVQWGMWGREGLDVYNGGEKRASWRGSGMGMKALWLSSSREKGSSPFPTLYDTSIYLIFC